MSLLWQRWRYVGTRRREPIGLGVPRLRAPTCEESQRPVRYGQDDLKRCRDDERLVSFAACLESENPQGRTCSSSWNRLVRTRIYGGVGRAAAEGHPYRICRILRLEARNTPHEWTRRSKHVRSIETSQSGNQPISAFEDALQLG